MIASITTTTITSITSVVASGVVAAVGLAVVIIWLALLGTKVIAGVSSSPRGRSIAAFINVGVIPLTIVFGAIFILKVIEIWH
jgi:hypothetical protein